MCFMFGISPHCDGIDMHGIFVNKLACMATMNPLLLLLLLLLLLWKHGSEGYYTQGNVQLPAGTGTQLPS